MHIAAFKTGTLEGGCHLDMRVDPLLTQNRHLGRSALEDIRSSNIFCRIKA